VEGIANLRILLTGASGFIGSHLGRELTRLGAVLHLLDRPGTPDFRIRDYKDQAVFHEIDLTDADSLRKIVLEIEPEKIFHLASVTNVERSLDKSTEITSNNLLGTLNLIRSLNGLSYHCFINTGTCEEYGDNPTPFHEDQMVNPVSPYSAAKASSTIFCQMYHKTLGLPIVTVRPFLTYGPYQDPKMLIPHTIISALKNESFKMTGGKQTREFNHVSDIVDGFIKSATVSEAIGEVINIGNAVEYKIRDVVELILDKMDAGIKPEIGALPYRAGETWHFFCSNEKAKRILGWEPMINLEDGIDQTIAWYQGVFDSGELFDWFPDN
jgi:nucleoside-diphosphate-sugar epimerase